MITIVLPCYNPSENWDNNLIANYKEISAQVNDTVELILVNDGSVTPFSNEKLAAINTEIEHFKFISYSVNKGKGFALREGIASASSDIIIYTDADFPYTTESFLSILEELRAGNDVVIGVKNEEYYKHVPFVRAIISKTLKKLVRFFLEIPITDTQCGLKGFNQEGKQVFLSTSIDRYLFDLEFVYKSYQSKKKLRVKPVSIILKPNVHFRKVNSRILFGELRNFFQIVFSKK